MGRRAIRCCICGSKVNDCPSNISWLNQFMGLYHGPQGVVLTGVGIYNDPDSNYFIAPPDPDARWDDPGYNAGPEDSFGVMFQSAQNGRYGFVFHSSCWDLLCLADPSSDGFLLSRLFDIFNSIPVPIRVLALSWGHDYGGILETVDNDLLYPWEDRYAPVPCTSDDIFINIDPLTNCLADNLVSQATERIPASNPPERREFLVEAQYNEILGLLPLEIRIEIAMRLSTADILRMRKATKTFWPIFSSQQFWASRFRLGSERSWLFEAQEANAVLDWQWLYQMSSTSQLDPGLRNRKRIWACIETIIACLDLKWMNKTSACMDRMPDQERYWFWPASAKILSGMQIGQLNEGCRAMFNKRATITRTIKRISVHFICLGEVEFVSGIRLWDLSGVVVELGYKSEIERFQDLSEFCGFNLAIGSRGIHAIRCVARDGSILPWLGRVKHAPLTRRTWLPYLVSFLDCWFDGLKMVQITTGFQRVPNETPQLWSKLSNTALWYPEFPDANFNLNDAYFPLLRYHSEIYAPLTWTHFGGPGGTLLHHLTKITVWFHSSVIAIKFTFDQKVPSKYCQLGQTVPLEVRTVEFNIDGPGGEVIADVRLFQVPNPLDMSLGGRLKDRVSGMFRTNRGRVCSFCHKDDTVDNLRTIPIAPGTTITGFYAGRFLFPDGLAFRSLGIISETVLGHPEKPAHLSMAKEFPI